MQLHFIWEAITVLLVGFCLLRIMGKKTVGDMTGLEMITLLAMASHIGHAIPGDGLLKSVLVICIFAAMLILFQFLAVKFNFVEKLFMGKATVVIEDGKIHAKNLKKLRFTVDQLEAKLRAAGISKLSDVKTATIEMSGELGYELMRHAKPVTIGELEKILTTAGLLHKKQNAGPTDSNLFREVKQEGHEHQIPPELN